MTRASTGIIAFGELIILMFQRMPTEFVIGMPATWILVMLLP